MKNLIIVPAILIFVVLLSLHFYDKLSNHTWPSKKQFPPSLNETSDDSGTLPETQSLEDETVQTLPQTPLTSETSVPLRFAPTQIEAVYGAEVTREGDSIRLRMKSAEWSSGIRIQPPVGGALNLSAGRYLAVDVENLSPDRQMRLTMHLSSGGKDSDSDDHATAILAKNRSINTGIGLNPGEKGTMQILLPHPEIYLAPPNSLGPYIIDTSHINNISLMVQWPYEAEFEWVVDCRLSNFRLIGTPDTKRAIAAADYTPFIDQFGQFVHDEWPAKVHSDNEFAADLARELAEMKAKPTSWDQYGGWAEGPQLTATGNFRTQKVNGKWFLVTPNGHLFFSLGIDVIRNFTDVTSAAKHRDWYQGTIPADDMMPFTGWNLQKKFGKEDYHADYYHFVLQRLDAWGINTLGNWSADALMELGKKPYTLSLADNDKSLPHVPGLKFYDCFDPEFESKLSTLLTSRLTDKPAFKKSTTDPMCIGYFFDNELQFGAIIAKMLAADGADCFAKRAFIGGMKTQYKTVAQLNAAWNTTFSDWADAQRPMQIPEGKGFRKDSEAFQEVWLDRYFSACRNGIRKIAPGKLYLGSRFVGFRQSRLLWEAATKYCDVVTVNTYGNSIFNLPEFISKTSIERPLLIGEFHFGALDRGMFKAGLCPVSNQAERARAYTRFVQGALCHPQVVGCHWFQYRDQPLVGRGDGEAYQIGFVDVCDRPYSELTNAAREVGQHMYTYRLRGKLENDMN